MEGEFPRMNKLEPRQRVGNNDVVNRKERKPISPQFRHSVGINGQSANYKTPHYRQNLRDSGSTPLLRTYAEANKG